MKSSFRILQGDALATLRGLEADSVDCCVTSPPYFGLRDYGVEGQMGLEPTPEAFVQAMVEVFREVRRVLKPTGTLWLNLGDSYAGARKGGHPSNTSTLDGPGSRAPRIASRRRDNEPIPRSDRAIPGLKAKDLIGIPWMVAFALRAYGWYLRRDIIWSKPNAMPEAVKDRPATAHEYVFLLSKCARYFYDAETIMEPVSGNTHARSAAAAAFPGSGERDENRRRPGVGPKAQKVPQGWDTSKGSHGTIHKQGRTRPRANESFSAAVVGAVERRNKRSVWTIPSRGFKGAHFATFPESLVEPCIMAGCPVGGLVLDPFAGSGTVGAVALRHFRRFVGIELNPAYVEIANRRVASAVPGPCLFQEPA